MQYGIELGYQSILNRRETIEAIWKIKSELIQKIQQQFNLTFVDSAIVTDKYIWLNDDFQGNLRPIDFEYDYGAEFGEIMQSNNKWRRWFLYRNDFEETNEGIITNHNLIKRDLKLSSVNSIVQSEIGFEIIADNKDLNNLQNIISDIYAAILEVNNNIVSEYPVLNSNSFSDQLIFITYNRLKKLYPLLNYEERINRFARDNGTFVLMSSSGQESVKIFDNFSQDVFDFKTYFNLFTYCAPAQAAVSIGYVSYTADRESLQLQNLSLKESEKNETGYNYLITMNKLPLTVSGGINLSLLSMNMLKKQHIGEVQNSLWSQKFLNFCEANDINIL